ncbi:UDP-glucose dehydrogenase family protein [Candidatus Pelagibacter sp.]|uniref:UDP-glucose dehydrogenase family protein n=1 Tax=Candidatus Pelagibacter sp. TaxID=2024849 RepID=UPI003F85533E
MKICVIGTGYVGLVSGTCFSEIGNNVACVDIDKKKIDKLNNGFVPIFEPGLEELIKRNVKHKRLNFSSKIEDNIKSSDIVFICVGTPTNKKSNQADLKQVFKVAKLIKNNLNKYKIIVNKSTVPVTTGDKIEKILNTKKNKNKFDVISNPEFLREGEAIRDFMYPDRVVIGSNSKKANSVMKNLYLPILKKRSRYFNCSRRAAELIKYASNAFLATKITFINEMANLCEKSNIDVKDISIGMGLDERIGDRFLRAGPAYGGSCFPKDTRALVTTAKSFNTDLSIVKTVINSNQNRNNLLNKRILKLLNNKINNKIITFLGVTFKAGTDDMRESPCLDMIPFLLKKGSTIKYYDPSGEKTNFFINKNVKFSPNIKDACNGADLIIIHTEWNEFKQINFRKLNKNKNLKVFDLRNLYSPSLMKKINIRYYGIGR